MTRRDNVIRLALQELSTAGLSDARGGAGVPEPVFTRFSGIGTVAGRAITANCAEGALQPAFAAIEQASEYDVLCIAGPGNTAYLGELLAANIVNRGLSGALIDGLVRDRAALATMPATFLARGVTPVNLRRQTPGIAMQPTPVGGITIAPGDWIIMDDDGVIVIPDNEVDDAISAAREGARIENRIRELVLQRMAVPEAVRQALAEIGGGNG